MEQKLIEMGFKKNLEDSVFTYYLGGSTFLHCIYNGASFFSFFGQDLDFNKCVPIWRSPRTLFELKTLVTLLSGDGLD